MLEIPSQIQIELFSKTFFSKIQFEKDGFIPPNLTKNLMPINIGHIWKQASLCRTTRSYFLYMLFFRKFPSKKMILHFPTQLNNWRTSVRAH